MYAARPDYHRNGRRWLAWVSEMRTNIVGLYGAEPQLCALLIGVPYVDLLARLNTIEAECRRAIGEPAEDEQATV